MSDAPRPRGPQARGADRAPNEAGASPGEEHAGGPSPVAPTPAEAGASLLERRADPRTNTIVKRVLRTGLTLALALLAVGLVIQLATHHDVARQVRMLDLAAAHPLGEEIMGFGVLVLALTPTCGVLSVLLSWIRERDRVYVGVGVVVVLVLGAAVAVGLAGG